jgi:hypothetical protein
MDGLNNDERNRDFIKWLQLVEQHCTPDGSNTEVIQLDYFPFFKEWVTITTFIVCSKNKWNEITEIESFPWYDSEGCERRSGHAVS